MRRPAQAPRRRTDTHYTCCKEPSCVFSTKNKGEPMMTHGTEKCMFCCNEMLAGLLQKKSGKSATQALNKLLA